MSVCVHVCICCISLLTLGSYAQDKGISVQHLQSMPEEDWRNLSLPMGPRLKLRKALERMGD